MANTAAINASECAKGNVHAKPKGGDAVLFYSFFPNGVRCAAVRCTLVANSLVFSMLFSRTRLYSLAWLYNLTLCRYNHIMPPPPAVLGPG